MIRAAPPMLCIALSLGACGGDAAQDAASERDPAIAAALDDPLMTDPDLSSRNEGAAALSVRVDGGLPVLPENPGSADAARAEAIALVGREGKLLPVPKADGRAPVLPPDHSPADHLSLLKDKTSCRAKLSDSAIWAARLPAALPVYPRGATTAATGGESVGCSVMAVTFTTPVAAEDVLAFYWQRATAAGLEPVHRSAGSQSVIQGEGAGTAFDLRVGTAGVLTTVELASVTD